MTRLIKHFGRNTGKRIPLFLGLMVLFGWLGADSVAWAGGAAKTVLAIHSYNRSYVWDRDLEDSLDRRLSKSGLKISVFHESLDVLRIDDPAFQIDFYEYLKAKYKHLKPDLVICTDNAAFSFLVNYRNWLFGPVPVVFVGVNGFNPRQLLGAKNFTGVSENPDMLSTLKVALRLFPKTKRLVVYGSWNTTYFANLKMLKDALAKIKLPLELTVRENWRISKILADVAKLPPDSLIISMAQVLNDQGHLMSVLRGAELISAAGHTPVFSFWDFFLNHGIVGGKLISAEEHGLKAAQMALKILEAPPGSPLPPVLHSPNRYMFDYKQLARFNLNLDELPQGSLVINQPDTIWEQHGRAIVLSSLSFALLLAIIAFLSFTVARRKRAERALKASEDYYRSLFDESPTPLLIQDFSRLKKRIDELRGSGVSDLRNYLTQNPDKLFELAGLIRPIRTNQATQDLYKAQCAQDFQINMGKYLVPGNLGHFLDQVVAIVQEGKNYRGEGLNKDLNGEILDVIIRKSVLPGHEHDLSRIMTSVTDVTMLKKMEQDLRDSTQKLREIFNAQSDAILILDTHVPPKILDVNQAAVRMFGYSRQEMLGRDTTFLHVSQESLTEFQGRLIPTVRRNGFLRLPEFTMRRKDGSVLQTENTVTPLKRDGGELIGWVNVVRDISWRVQAEEELKASEKRYRLLIQKMPTSIMTFNADGFVTYVNEYHLKTFARNKHGAGFFLGQKITELPGIKRAGLTPELEKLLQGREISIEAAHFPAFSGGHSGYQDIRGVPIYEADEFMGGILIRSDSTQRMRIAEEKRQLQAQLHQSQKMEAIGTLAGGIAHDFNNILAAITGFTELALEDAQYGELDQENLTQVLKAADKAKELVQRILTFSRRGSMEQKVTDLNRIVTGSLDMLRRTIPRMINIEADLAPDLMAVKGNPTQLEQVLLNLGSNAKDAMPSGGELRLQTKNVFARNLHCSACGQLFSGRYVRLSVSDSGQGIDQMSLKQIFDPFFTTKEVGKGTGLGLSMVMGIVKNHVGHIQCLSQVGEGTTFSLYLPVFATEGYDDKDQEEPIAERPASGSETILLVDDEPSLCDLAGRILERKGYQVIKASNGEDALEVFRDKRDSIDLIVLDLNMPGMGGRKCLEEILRLDPEVKVIIASGYASSRELESIPASVSVAYVAKPFHNIELLKAVRSLLDSPQ